MFVSNSREPLGVKRQQEPSGAERLAGGQEAAGGGGSEGQGPDPETPC